MDKETRTKMQTLFDNVFGRFLKSELKNMMSASTATFLVAILRAIIEILRVAFPGRNRRPRKQLDPPPK